MLTICASRPILFEELEILRDIQRRPAFRERRVGENRIYSNFLSCPLRYCQDQQKMSAFSENCERKKIQNRFARNVPEVKSNRSSFR